MIVQVSAKNKTVTVALEYGEPNFTEKKDALKQAGFSWNAAAKRWEFLNQPVDILLTTVKKVKESLEDVMSDDEIKLFHEIIQELEEEAQEEKRRKEEEKRRLLDSLHIPAKDNLTYRDYQKEFVAFAKDRKHVLLADEMGLGKTIQAIALINYLEANQNKFNKILIICPAFLKQNWYNEIKKWYVGDLKPIVLQTKNMGKIEEDGIFIVNYEILKNLPTQRFDIIVYDEAHYVKNPDAKRTINALLLKANRYLFLTGTPVLNKINEIIPIFNKIQYEYQRKEDIKKQYWNTAFKYFKVESNGYGREVMGIKNPEFKQILNSWMLRRLKQDVLQELPSKNRIPLFVDEDQKMQKLLQEQMKLFQTYVVQRQKNVSETQEQEQEGQEEKQKIKTEPDIPLSEMIEQIYGLYMQSNLPLSRLLYSRIYTSLKKVETAALFAADVLETEDKLIIVSSFEIVAKYMLQELKEKLNGVKLSFISGSVPAEERAKIVCDFQETKEKHVIIGTIKSMGVGLTLTAAKTMVFLDTTYTPADMFQMEDRIHRMGQKESVNIYYLVFPGSVDEYMFNTLQGKQAEISQILQHSETNDFDFNLKPEQTKNFNNANFVTM